MDPLAWFGCDGELIYLATGISCLMPNCTTRIVCGGSQTANKRSLSMASNIGAQNWTPRGWGGEPLFLSLSTATEIHWRHAGGRRDSDAATQYISRRGEMGIMGCISTHVRVDKIKQEMLANPCLLVSVTANWRPSTASPHGARVRERKLMKLSSFLPWKFFFFSRHFPFLGDSLTV